MAVTYATLFGRLGKLFGMAEDIRTHQAALRTQYAAIIGQYSSADSYMVGKLTDQLEARIADSTRLLRVIKSDAERTLIDMVDDDLVSSNGGGLESKNTRVALRELIRQMDSGSSSIDGTTISFGSVSAGASNVGNGTLVLSALASQEYAPTVVDYPSVLTELVRAQCVADEYSVSADANAESFRVRGQRHEAALHDEWPKGSGMDTFANVVSPGFFAGNGPGLNVLKNSNFESFTSNAPDFWSIDTGSAGTDVDDITTPFTGSTALKIVGDGSTAVKVSQTLNNIGGTLGSVNPDKPYTISFAVRTNGGALSAGSLKVSLQDGSGNIMNASDANRKMVIQIDHNTVGALTSTYQLYTLDCMTPAHLPKGAKFVIETNPAFNSGVELYIDDVILAEMHRPIPGGLAFQLIPGSTAFAAEDELTVQVTNNNEGKFAREFDRFFGMAGLGFALPSNYAGSETINDSLIS